MLAIDICTSLGEFELEVTTKIPLDGITGILGPSGSGKTTLLRVLAGFEPAEGRIIVDDEVWLDTKSKTDIAPHRRSLGYMFQDTRLFEHLSVAGNLEYATSRTLSEIKQIVVDDVVDAFDLSPLLKRRPAELSGGEKQRVALARTLLTNPRFLVLDEPLSALDEQRRSDILPYIDTMASQFQVPALYVSHAVGEVAHIARRILALSNGRVQANGPTNEILERLDLLDVTGRFEAGSVVEATVIDHVERHRLTRLIIDGQTLTMPMEPGLAPGDQIRLRVRARDVALALIRPESISIRNILDATIVDLFHGPGSPYVEALVEFQKQRLRARITLASVEDLSLAVGMHVFVLIKSVTFESSLA